MIIATAGHVDHGKTSLVRALTGVDTDALPDEKRRGMTIEPGYAHAELDAGVTVSFVDVPGHERFIRNMLSGIAAIDAALLVVAADDGPMPQTLEHLAVLDLLGVSRAAVAITKVDRVDPARIEQVRSAIGLLGGGSLRDAAVFEVSTLSGQGVEALRRHLADMQRGIPARTPDGAFRLAVDRRFSRPGAGTIVTGAVLSGRVAAGDKLLISPAGHPARVRAVQVHGLEVQHAHAGQRCALNLAAAGGEHLEVERGDWVLAPCAHAPTMRLDASLRLLADLPSPLKAGASLQLHIGAAACAARVIPLAQRQLEPGATGLVQLLLAAPVSALHADRFVLRDAAARRFVGGGAVLDPFAPARRRAWPERLADLQALAEPALPHVLERLLAAHGEGVEWYRFAQAMNLDDGQQAALRSQVPAHEAAHAGGLRLVAPAHWHALQARVKQVLADSHAQHPESLGMTEAALVAALAPAGDGVVRRAAIRAERAAGRIVRDGFVFRLPGHAARLSAEDAARLHQVINVMQPFGLRPPPLGELAPLLDMPLAQASAFLERAAALGHLVRVAKNRFFLPATIDELVAIARQTALDAPDGRFDAASFRDRSGIGRNLSIQLLEFFDRSGMTRLAADRRRWMAVPTQD
ncbi:MAG TPA: selenocysteine-specific translation elongation factor [Ramlibacter sp.]|nr:selenocysteine-specific translation elongation factor [Ramlibacter sp.]